MRIVVHLGLSGWRFDIPHHPTSSHVIFSNIGTLTHTESWDILGHFTYPTHLVAKVDYPILNSSSPAGKHPPLGQFSAMASLESQILTVGVEHNPSLREKLEELLGSPWEVRIQRKSFRGKMRFAGRRIGSITPTLNVLCTTKCLVASHGLDSEKSSLPAGCSSFAERHHGNFQGSGSFSKTGGSKFHNQGSQSIHHFSGVVCHDCSHCLCCGASPPTT